MAKLKVVEKIKTREAELLVELVLATFRLEGNFMRAAERIAATAGLTAARWKVLGAVIRSPRTVSDIARDMGLSRQAVQRLANTLMDEGKVVLIPNPARKSAPLVKLTRQGAKNIQGLGAAHTQWANAVGAKLTEREIKKCIELVRRISGAAESVEQFGEKGPA